ncbi:MAG: hypothetical protein AAF311_00875 [Pseudomonadota bacterium]
MPSFRGLDTNTARGGFAATGLGLPTLACLVGLAVVAAAVLLVHRPVAGSDAFFSSPSERVLVPRGPDATPEDVAIRQSELADGKTLADVLAQAPLSVEPLLHRYSTLPERSDEATRMALLDGVLLRNGRSRAGLHQSLETHYGQGDFRAVLDIANELYVLEPDYQGSLDALVSLLYETEDGYAAIRDKLESNPGWAYSLFTTKIATATPDTAGRLWSAASGWLEANRDAAWHGDYLAQITEKWLLIGLTEEAKTLWLEEAARQGLSVRASDIDTFDFANFNSDFGTDAAHGAFDWRMVESPEGSAEITDGRIELRYRGDKEAFLVRKFVTMPAVRFRLTARLAATRSQRPEAFSFRLSCIHPTLSQRTLTLNPVDEADMVYATEVKRFVRPCETAVLDILGVPELYSKRSRLSIDTLQLEGVAPSASAQPASRPARNR